MTCCNHTSLASTAAKSNPNNMQAGESIGEAALNQLSAPDGVDALLWQLSSSSERRQLLDHQTGQYTVQRGDTLHGIAAEQGVALADLLTANPAISNPNLIHPGQVINLPQATDTSPSAPPATTAGNISEAGLEFIAEHEGMELQLYNDPAGHATIGVGHLVHLGPINGSASEAPFANGISREQALELLQQDAGTAEAAVSRLVTVPLNQNQFDALVSFTFNVGAGNLENSTLLTKLNQGDYASVPTELNRWNKARVNGELQELPGLTRRRQAEGDLFSTPVGSTPVETPTVPDVVLRSGSRGETVTLLQQQLQAAGFNPGPADGLFGARTETAVRAFQQSRGLAVDGIVGPQTWRALGVQQQPPVTGDAVTVSTGPEQSNADLWVKSSADIDSLGAEIEITFDDIVAVWAENNGPTPVITSGNDGRHSTNSFHYRDLAIDLRANNITDSSAATIAADLQARLGDDYDVIFERFPNNPANDHIHLEYDPN